MTSASSCFRVMTIPAWESFVDLRCEIIVIHKRLFSGEFAEIHAFDAAFDRGGEQILFNCRTGGVRHPRRCTRTEHERRCRGSERIDAPFHKTFLS